MVHQRTTNSDATLRHEERTSKSTSLQISSEQDFKISRDERPLETPRRFTLFSNADYSDLNDENFRSAPIFKFVNKPDPKANTLTPVKRTPLTDVTKETFGRLRSTSDLLARIASLEDELEQSKKQNEKLRGDIVGYQDALNQADMDAGYF